MTSKRIKQYLKTHCGFVASVTTSPGKARWITASIIGRHDPQRNAYIMENTFPVELRQRCIKIVYPNNPKLHTQVSAGNIDSHRIAMVEREWLQLIGASKVVVIGPDEIPLRPDPFNSEAEARAFAAEWCKRFEKQGYYYACFGRIELSDLPSHIRYEEVA